MFRTLALLAAAASITAAVAPAAYAQTATVEKAAIEQALARGRLLYAYDQAAWHGTDDMLTKVAKPGETIGGYIVDGPAATPTLIFYDKDPREPHAVYIAQFRDNKLVSGRVLGADDDRKISPARMTMILARGTGVSEWKRVGALYCGTTSPNTVVLSPEWAGGPYLVYVLSPPSKANAYPIGGHFRVEVDADGSPGALRVFSKGCMDATVPEGASTAPIAVSHLIDPVPTEIHVFTALASGHPLTVSTPNGKSWTVTAAGIAAKK
jgi:hypothetical protein